MPGLVAIQNFRNIFKTNKEFFKEILFLKNGIKVTRPIRKITKQNFNARLDKVIIDNPGGVFIISGKSGIGKSSYLKDYAITKPDTIYLDKSCLCPLIFKTLFTTPNDPKKIRSNKMLLGIDFDLNQEGLSLGQSQRKLLYLVSFTKYKKIILDEVLSGLDGGSSLQAYKFIEKESLNKNYIIVDHGEKHTSLLKKSCHLQIT